MLKEKERINTKRERKREARRNTEGTKRERKSEKE